MGKEWKGFNIRVYALIFNENNEVLLSDEYQLGTQMTKFPGGGMKYGEGTIDALKREAVEEFGQEIEVIRHFYTLDYFQPSMFYKEYQLLSIYYLARFKEEPLFQVSNKPFDFEEMKNGNISFRWKPVNQLNPGDMTLPVDQKVAAMLHSEYL